MTKYICIENGIYFTSGNIYLLREAPNNYNNNWMAVCNLEGEELCQIFKTLLDFYFTNLAQFREDNINDIIND